MRGVNKVILLGNIGQDPDFKYTPNGTLIARLSLATSRGKKDRNGEWQEVTTWHRVVFYGKPAETIKEYVAKGSPLYVEGELESRSWEDTEGKKHYVTEIIGHELRLIGGKKDASTGSASGKNGKQGGNGNSAADDDVPDWVRDQEDF
jgi:single-strand DNA-binding protein